MVLYPSLYTFFNPLKQALAMGATFDRDLTRMTTHLICAFANTPKAKKFQGGFIVKKEWISIQHATKRRHSWRKYSWKDEDYESDEEDLYFDKKPENKEETNPEDIDTDDEINEALKKQETKTQETAKEEPTERILRKVQKDETKVDIVKVI